MVYRQPSQIHLEEPDCASIEHNGVFYRCYSFIDNNGFGGSARITSACYVEQDQGQDVLLFTEDIATGTASDWQTDCPKIIAIGTKFIVHAIDLSGGAGNYTLERYYIDVTDLHNTSTWTKVTGGTAPTIHDDALYDVHDAGNDTSFYIGYKNSSGDVRLEKHTIVTFWSSDFAQNFSQTPVNALGVYGNQDDNIIMASYEKATTNEMWTSRMDADGSNDASVKALSQVPDAEYSQIGHCRIDALTTAVVAEVLTDDVVTAENEARCLYYAKLTNSTGGREGNEHWCYNLSLFSRPWSYASHKSDGSAPDVYACVGFKSLRGNSSWEQKNFYVVNFDQQEWTESQESVRPRPCCTLNLGTADARPGGIPSNLHAVQRRNNNISHVSGPPTFGPLVKAKTFAAVVWNRMTTAYSGNATHGPELFPMVPSVVGYHFHHEEPWYEYRDVNSPADPTVNFKGPYPWGNHRGVPAGRGLALSGGTPSMYDGSQCSEINFLWWPELMDTVTQDVVTDGIKIGEYQYTVTYEWRDAQGQLHRSRPCAPKHVSVTVDDREVNLRVRSINLTLKQSHHHPRAPTIDVVLWRTLSGGSTFHRVYSSDNNAAIGMDDYTIEKTPQNAIDAPTVAVTDLVNDDNLQHHEILPYVYTEALDWSPLPAQAPPANPIIARWQNRVWLAGGEEPRNVWYSLELLPEQGGVINSAPEFNANLIYRLDETSGITAMQPMDNVLVVFTHDSIYALSGDGADGTGAGATLSHQTIAQGTGCIEPNSVVLGPDGVFFQSEKGYYLLTRTFELDYLSAGADAEDIFRNAGNIRAATLMEDRHQIRLVLNEAVKADYRVLIYDYLWKQWSRIPLNATNANAFRSAHVDGIAWRGHANEIAHVVLTGAQLLVERTSGADSYKDDAIGIEKVIPIAVQTGWINVAGISGFKRVTKIVIQTEKPQGSEVHVDVDYEVDGKYDASKSDTFRFPEPAPEAMVIRPSIQKVTAIRLKVYEPDTAPLTENISVNSITLEVGIKQGTARLPDAHVGRI